MPARRPACAGPSTFPLLASIGSNRYLFSVSKLASDEVLMKLDLDWIVLRPSVVLGRPVFGASALFRGLSALPVLPFMPNTGRLQVVLLDDVVETVVFFLSGGQPLADCIDLAGPDAFTREEVVAQYRRWFGWKAARVLALPGWAARLLYRLGDAASIGMATPHAHQRRPRNRPRGDR
jgi:uncharacterized protein YbjT (DUF2867 family)